MIVKHLSVKHRKTLDSESALFNGFFRLEKLSIFETLGKKLTCLTITIYCMGDRGYSTVPGYSSTISIVRSIPFAVLIYDRVLYDRVSCAAAAAAAAPAGGSLRRHAAPFRPDRQVPMVH